jgi:hypothetical protein
MKIFTHNALTDEATVREATQDEVAQFTADAAFVENLKNEAERKKSAAQAKLAALGLTAEDLQALGL